MSARKCCCFPGFIGNPDRRRQVKRKRMPAVPADELGKSEAAAAKADEMAKKDTHERMPDTALASRLPQERVPAETGILYSSIPLRDRMNSMGQHSTRVVDAFPECLLARLRIAFPCQDQWVSAADTNILVMTITIPGKMVDMTAKETAQCMSNTRVPAVSPKILGTAAAPGPTITRTQFAIIHLVTEQKTRDSLQSFREPPHGTLTFFPPEVNRHQARRDSRYCNQPEDRPPLSVP